jgi:hypothetical protein
MEIIVDDLTGPEIAEFIEVHIEEMKAVALSPESKHALDLDGLRVPEVTSGRRSRTERSWDAVRSSCSATTMQRSSRCASRRRTDSAGWHQRSFDTSSPSPGGWKSRACLSRPGRSRSPSRLDASISSTASSSAVLSATTNPIPTAPS